MRVVYLCWTNGLSLHNVGRALVAPMAARGIAVDVVDSRAWFAAPSPADVVFLAHTDFLWPDFDYRRWAGALVTVVHDPDEVSRFGDRLTWAREPLRHRPEFAAFDRVLTCSAEMHAVLRGRYGLDAYLAATFPHNAAPVRAAACRREGGGGTMDARVRVISTAYGPAPASLADVARRLARPGAWLRDEHGRFAPRLLRAAVLRAHRKNPAWLARLERALAGDARVAVDLRHGPHAASLTEADYLARLAGADVYVCTSMMEGGPLPVMEAVLAGLAVVTTPVGQTSGWVEDGASGVVVRSYAELERAVRRYLDHPGLLAAHRARARAIGAARAFDADGWEAFLRGTARREPPGPSAS